MGSDTDKMSWRLLQQFWVLWTETKDFVSLLKPP